MFLSCLSTVLQQMEPAPSTRSESPDTPMEEGASPGENASGISDQFAAAAIAGPAEGPVVKPAATRARKRARPAEEKEEEPPLPPTVRRNRSRDLIQACGAGPVQSRSFVQIVRDLTQEIHTGAKQLHTGAVNEMNINLVVQEWLGLQSLRRLGKNISLLLYLRTGELYDRIVFLLEENENILEIEVGANRLREHFSHPLDFLQRRFKYEEKDKDDLRACHHLFAVWKIFPRILNVVLQPNYSWSTLRPLLTRDKLKIAAEEFQRDLTREGIEPNPGPVSARACWRQFMSCDLYYRFEGDRIVQAAVVQRHLGRLRACAYEINADGVDMQSFFLSHRHAFRPIGIEIAATLYLFQRSRQGRA